MTNPEPIILGIDPGCLVAGFGIIKMVQRRVMLLDHGTLILSGKLPLFRRIGIFYDTMQEKIVTHKITTIAIETPFLGKNAQNFLKLGYLRGIIYLLQDQYNLNLYEFSPSEVKKRITGFGGADKEQVARLLMRLFPALQMPQKYDVTDAIAVTLCGAWSQESTYAQLMR